MIHFKSSSLIALTVSLSALSLAACEEQKAATSSQPATEAPKAAVAAKPASLAKTEEAKPLSGAQLAEWYGKCWDQFNTKQWADFSKCYSEDAVSMRGTEPGIAFKGRSEIIEKNAKAFVTAFPDVKGERQITLVNGNKIVSMALIRGTHTGPLVGPGGTIPATNKKFGQMMLHSVEVNAKGEASKQWEVSDSPTLLAQLGLSKDPARPVMTQGIGEPAVAIAKNDKTEADNVANHKKAYELFNRQDKAMLDILADDGVIVEYGMPNDIKGRQAATMFMQGNWKAFSDMKMVADEIWAAGDYTYATGHMTGTNDGDMPAMKLKKTGKKVDLRFGEIVKWENGKAKAVYPFTDNLEFATQLGLVAPPSATDNQAAAAQPSKAASEPGKPAAAEPGKAAAPAAGKAAPASH
jgi:predicted ester cyclase